MLCFSPKRPPIAGETATSSQRSQAPEVHVASVDCFIKRHSTPHALDPLGIRQVAERLYCGPRPNAAMLDALKQVGVKTIINLEDYHTYWGWFGWRTRALAEGANLAMVRQPVSPLFWVSKSRIKSIVDILADPARGPFYVHCLFGKERTNLVVALHRRVNEALPKNLVRRAMYDDGFRPQLVPLLASQVDELLTTPQTSPLRAAVAALSLPQPEAPPSPS